MREYPMRSGIAWKKKCSQVVRRTIFRRGDPAGDACGMKACGLPGLALIHFSLMVVLSFEEFSLRSDALQVNELRAVMAGPCNAVP